MIEVARCLYVGSQADYEGATWGSDWYFVHACKEPHHREALGYTGRAAPKDHPEYLWAHRPGRLILNIVDAADPQYIQQAMIDEAVRFIRDHISTGQNVFIHCNQGRSRSPTIAMLAIAPGLSADFIAAEEQFNGLYPPFAPARGMREFARANWSRYHERPTQVQREPGDHSNGQDEKEEGRRLLTAATARSTPVDSRRLPLLVPETPLDVRMH